MSEWRERDEGGLTIRWLVEGEIDELRVISHLHVIVDLVEHPYGLSAKLLREVRVGELVRELISESARDSLKNLRS